MRGILTTLILGAAVAEFGLTGLEHENGSAYQPSENASAVYERIVPISASGPPPGLVVPSSAGIEKDVEAGVRELDRGVRKLPGYAVKVAESVEQHGIAALAYEDSEVKRAGNEIGTVIGTGIRHFSMAVGKDLLAGARQSGLGGRVGN